MISKKKLKTQLKSISTIKKPDIFNTVPISSYLFSKKGRVNKDNNPVANKVENNNKIDRLFKGTNLVEVIHKTDKKISTTKNIA